MHKDLTEKQAIRVMKMLSLPKGAMIQSIRNYLRSENIRPYVIEKIILQVKHYNRQKFLERKARKQSRKEKREL